MHDALRVIDANFNRSREALRVAEEYARFCLDDVTLTERCKALRHDVTNAICGLQLRVETGARLGRGGTNDAASALIASRDTTGDVGTEIANDAEYEREDTLQVAMAATGRLTESLRAIEEFTKIIDGAVAKRIEQLRYRAYDLQQALEMTARARKRFADARLYVLITEALCRNDWFETARLVLDNGADCIQLREKTLSDADLLDRATRLARLCRERGKLFIVNDRPDIATASGADGVHLGHDDVDVRSARRVLPSGAIVGVSTHTAAEIESAIRDTPDYVAIGPMFASDTKPQDHIAGCETLVAASERTALPLVAIGGLDAARSGEIVARAACCICVCSSIISQSDVSAATRNIRSVIDKAWQLRQDG